MAKNKEINCPHYNGDGYTYEFDKLEFNFCDSCNKKLLKQMIEQKKIEDSL